MMKILFQAMSEALAEMPDADEFPIALDDSAKRRIRVIAEEHGTTEYEVIRTFAEEGALRYFRRAKIDPGAKS